MKQLLVLRKCKRQLLQTQKKSLNSLASLRGTWTYVSLQTKSFLSFIYYPFPFPIQSFEPWHEWEDLTYFVFRVSQSRFIDWWFKLPLIEFFFKISKMLWFLQPLVYFFIVGLTNFLCLHSRNDIVLLVSWHKWKCLEWDILKLLASLEQKWIFSNTC